MRGTPDDRMWNMDAWEAAFGPQQRQIILGFLALMEGKPYEKITVKELTQQCAIARTTFYRHFEDIYDLVEQLEQYLLRELVLYSPSTLEHETVRQGKPYDSIEHWLQRGIDHRFILKEIMGEHGDLYFKERLLSHLEAELNEMMDDEHVPRDRQRPAYVSFIAASYIGLLNHIALVDESELLPASEYAFMANSIRIAYFRSGDNPPSTTEAQLFGSTR